MFLNVPLVCETDFYGQKLRLESGLLALQATSNVVATLGETTIMANVMVGKPTSGDYFPLQVIYEEKMYASGKIHGSRFIKREGRPSEQAILTGRMIDRSLRSLFDSHIRNELQVIITVLSVDEVNSPDLVAVLAASAALGLCGFTSNQLGENVYQGPISSIRIGLEQTSLGENWLQQIQNILPTATDFSDLTSLLTDISKTLSTSVDEDKEWIRKIAKEVANKNLDWAKEFSNLYKATQKLSKSELQEQFPVKHNVLVNPSYANQGISLLDLVVSGNGQNIMMVEAGADIVSEELVGECLDAACKELETLTNFQQEFLEKAKQQNCIKETVLSLVLPEEKFEQYWHQHQTEIELCMYFEGSKEEKKQKLEDFTQSHFNNLEHLVSVLNQKGISTIDEAREFLVSHADDTTHSESAAILKDKDFNLKICQNLLNLVQEDGLPSLTSIKKGLLEALEGVMKNIFKQKILTEEQRVDGRKLDEVRKITCQVDTLPRVHGSSLFQRGETQVLNILTLGTLQDAQLLDNMEDFEEVSKRYIHHYNFPSYSVGETGRYGPPGRREIGHGALAEKALLPVLPKEEDFPYTMRLVSECLGSNGSTSMASTCGSCLSLMAGGVPIKDMVAGIAMGLVIDTYGSDNPASTHFKVLTDIQGIEDHNGDMDFKVTGTKDGVTAIQLDNKVAGLTSAILKQALIEAKSGRMFILQKMQEAISKPRESISEHAPVVDTLVVPMEKIGEVIGPSGRVIKGLIQKYDVNIDIEDETGRAYIYGRDKEKNAKVKNIIQRIIKGYQTGEEVEGKIFRIESYGVFVKIFDDGEESAKEGMIHISNLAKRRINKPEDVVKMGQIVACKVLEVNDKGQIALTLANKE